MKFLVVLCICWLFLTLGMAAEPTAGPKPKLKLAADHFPAGHGTPEGAACDLARAFITRDVTLFADICIKPFGGGENRKSYEDFLSGVAESMKAEAARKDPSPDGPKMIGEVFAARHLSKSGPASYGYAAFNFEDVMFVDVGAILQSGEQSLNRTLVVKKGGKWYVEPAPRYSPLLSDGLNEETPSSQDFAESYEVEP